MSYSIQYKQTVVEDHISLLGKKDALHIRNAIETKLTSEPTLFGKPLRYSKKGLWSLRVGDHRVIYTINGEVVTIVAIGHRRDVYKK